MDAERRAQLIAEKARLEVMLAESQRAKRMAAFERQKARGDFDVEYRATDGMSAKEKFGAGVASGTLQLLKGAGNMLGVVSDETAREQREKDQDLSDTGWGTVGQMTAQALLTAPVGGAVGAAAKGLSKLPQATRAVQAVGRGLGSGYGRAAVEGAVDAAVMADPDNRGAAALEGMLWGAGTRGVLSAAGRGVRGLAQKSGDAQVLETYAQQHGREGFVPLAQAAADEGDLLSRGVKSLYKEALPYVPGVSGQFNAQERRLARDFRATALKEADERLGVLTKRDLENPTQAVQKLKGAVDNHLKSTVKTYTFRLPSESHMDVALEKLVKRDFPNVDSETLSAVKSMFKGHLARFNDGLGKSAGKNIVGENLLEAKNAFSRQITRLSGRERAVAQKVLGQFDEIIRQQLSRGTPDQVAALAKYEDGLESWASIRALEEATSKAVVKSGDFTPAQLARSAVSSPNERVLAQTFEKVMSNKLGVPGAPGRWFGRAMTGIAAWQGGPVSALVGLGIGNSLATKSVQKALMGDTKAQQFVINALRKHPHYAEMIESGLTAGVAGQAEQ